MIREFQRDDINKVADIWLDTNIKAHKYWSIGAIVTMVGTFYTGYKGLKAAHKYFAFGSLICMIMAVYSGHKMISGNKRTRKQVENTKAEE
mgnify:CR=1 FL=1